MIQSLDKHDWNLRKIEKKFVLDIQIHFYHSNKIYANNKVNLIIIDEETGWMSQAVN